MLSLFGNALMSIVSGGATGLIGSIVSGWTELKKQQELNRHAEAMADKDYQMTKLEVEGRVQIADTEADAAILTTSYSHDSAAYATDAKDSKWFVFVDVIRGLTRPGLTLYMTGLVTAMWLELNLIIGGMSAALDAEMMTQIYLQIINAVLYITTTIALWWFGTRNKAKAP